MNPAKLLLIEDTASDATLFCDRIQNQLGNEVEIEWKTRLSDALAWLEAGNSPDQIWLDPALPDLGQQNLAKALATLKRYVAVGELRLLSSTVTRAIEGAAEQQSVQVLGKKSLTDSSSNSEILKIVQELVSRRSSGTTAKIATAKLEGAIAKLEYQFAENAKRMNRHDEALERLSTVSFELASIKEAIASLPEIKKKLSELHDRKELSVKRIDALQAVIIALISGLVALGTVALPKLLDAEHPNPEPSSPASPNH